MPEESFSSELVAEIGHIALQIAIISAVALVAIHFGRRLISRFVHRVTKTHAFATAEDRKQREQTVTGILGAIFNVVVFVMATLMILTAVGVNIGPMIAGAGIASLAVGFGAQGLVADFIAGVFIIMENQIRIGDSVTLSDSVDAKSGVSGVVQKISIRTTVLRDIDGNLHYIPNGQIRLATNMSMEYSNINLNIAVSYDTNVDKLKKIINKVGTELAHDPELGKLIIDTPQFARVDMFTESSLEVKVTGKVRAGEQWKITGELRERLKKSFDKEGIEMPYQRRVVKQVSEKKPKA